VKKIVVENDLSKILNISATPNPTGNTVGLGHYVTDNKGSTYFIDRTGKAILIRKLTTDWNYPELLNGFTNYEHGFAPARWRVDNGVLYIEGLVKRGSRSKIIFKLPRSITPFIPDKTIHVVDRSGSSNGRVDVRSSGAVVGIDIGTSWTSIQISKVLDI
jgi:hypothetical protein